MKLLKIASAILLLLSVLNAQTYKQFKRSTNVKSYKVYKNHSLLRKRANTRNSKLIVDISEQRVKLYINNRVAIDSPCTTGARRKFEPNTKIYRDKRTPKGNFRVTEKIKNKRSNIFGDYYRNGKRIYHGDRRKFRGSKRGAKFIGASLKYWMRITGSGIGFHESKYVKRHPGTNGCIRLPKSVASTLFRKIDKGTRVKVIR